MGASDPGLRALYLAIDNAPVPGSPAPGWRRSRLWELDPESRAAALGACLPAAERRRLLEQCEGLRGGLGDYPLYRALVAQCGGRNRVAQALQQCLERRFAATVAAFDAVRGAAGLWGLWSEAAQAGHSAAALWAALTHPACDAALRERICQDLLLTQFQLLAAESDGHAQRRALVAENQVLARALARVQQRHSAWHAEREAERLRMQQELDGLRGALAQAVRGV